MDHRPCGYFLIAVRIRQRRKTMIELTEQQRHDLGQGKPVRVRDSQTNESWVLMRPELFDRMRDAIYDDSPWTDEEMDALAWEAGQLAGWDNMDEYDHYREGK